MEASSAFWSLIRGWGNLTHPCLVPSLFKYTFSYDFLSTLMEIPGLSFLNTGLHVALWILDYRGRWKVHLLEKPLGRKEPYLTKPHGYCVSWSHRGRLQRNASWWKGEMWGREWKEKELGFMFLEKNSRVWKGAEISPQIVTTCVNIGLGHIFKSLLSLSWWLTLFWDFFFPQELFHSTYIRLLLNARCRTRPSECGSSVWSVGTATMQTVVYCGTGKWVGVEDSEILNK